MVETPLHFKTISELTLLIKERKITSVELTSYFLERIRNLNPTLKAYSLICDDRALKKAQQIDKIIKNGGKLGPLAGVPFAVKNLFDIKGNVTLAGSKINYNNKVAKQDATLIRRMERDGAILLGATSMGEFAYDFTGENIHFGNCQNPHKLGHMSGGSSSGSASATSAGIAPISLGSDTNGSIRVPASFCGIFGLKPTYGRLPRTGTYPFVDSLDHLGLFARNIPDLSQCFDLIQGFDEKDHVCTNRENIATHSQIGLGIKNLRIAKAGGYFSTKNFPQAKKAIDKVCESLSVNSTVNIDGTLEGRAAAYIITNVEGSLLHRDHLKKNLSDFDPDTRDRFIAGAMLPGSWYVRSQQVRKWFKDKFLAKFNEVDIIIAPATPCTAPAIGQKKILINQQEELLRPNLGYFTQPISAIGLPSCVIPTIDEESQLPIGVQIIAPPWREDLCLRVANFLENKGFSSPSPLENDSFFKTEKI